MKLINRRLASHQSGFTLIELLVVISIISLLSSIIFVALSEAREKGRLTEAIVSARALAHAAEAFEIDIDCPAPDVPRGWDPGLIQGEPQNHEGIENPGAPYGGGGIYRYACPDADDLTWPARYITRWGGPYITRWPGANPWGGTYDYNYWPFNFVRIPGCPEMNSGIYIGIETSAFDRNVGILPRSAEQALLNRGLDADNCLNGEAQILVKTLPPLGTL